MGKRPFPDPEQAPPQTAQKKPDDSGRTCSYQQNETIIRIKYSRSKRFEPSSYPFPSIRQELLPRGLPTSRKSLEGERRGLGGGEREPFSRKVPSPPSIFCYFFFFLLLPPRRFSTPLMILSPMDSSALDSNSRSSSSWRAERLVGVFTRISTSRSPLRFWLR